MVRAGIIEFKVRAWIVTQRTQHHGEKDSIQLWPVFRGPKVSPDRSYRRACPQPEREKLVQALPLIMAVQIKDTRRGH